MKYRDILGFSNAKKKNIKKSYKPKKNKIIESINKEIENYPMGQFQKMKEESDKEITNIPDSPFEKDNEDVKNESELNETLPQFPKEWKNVQKSCYDLEKSVINLGKAVGKQDKSRGKMILNTYKTLKKNIENYKEMLKRDILSKLQ